MKLVRFRDPSGYIRKGEWKENIIKTKYQEFDPETVEILPPSNPSKIVCVGLNYKDHIEETGKDKPERPMLFLKSPNTVIGHQDTVHLLNDKKRFDYEAELGVVIGEQCRNVPKDKVMEIVKGFTCLNDISNRHDQDKEQNWVRGKAFDNAAPIGPVIATSEEVPKDAEIKLELNGELKQSSDRSQLLFSVPELLEEITEYMTLEPGDIIATGTTSGIGPLSDGDKVEIKIEGIGSLINYVKS